jgi:trk system potassium uptake protein TrkA
VSSLSSRYAVIAGCGRLGAHLASRLGAAGTSVVVIDPDPRSFERLAEGFSGFTLEGDASEVGLLRQAKTARADLFIAASDDDNVNLMAGQVARTILGVERVLVRIGDPETADLARALGLQVFLPTVIVADDLLGRGSD